MDDVDYGRPWYHGSFLNLTVLRDGSSITQNRKLAEAFSTALKAGSLRNGAIWMMSDHHLITMVSDEGRLPRTVFLEVPFVW